MHYAMAIQENAGKVWIIIYAQKKKKQLRIDRNFFSVHEEITSIRLYTPGNSGLRKGVYNLIEVISNEPNKIISINH
jgi:hypothetical protein